MSLARQSNLFTKNSSSLTTILGSAVDWAVLDCIIGVAAADLFAGTGTVTLSLVVFKFMFSVFRTLRRSGNMSYTLFLNNRKEVLLRYCESKQANDFQALFECVVIEQFKYSLPADVQAFVLSHQLSCKTIDDYGKIADLSYAVKRVAVADEAKSVAQANSRAGNSYKPVGFSHGPRPQARPISKVI